jgi:acyl-CoA thioester hydrolase
VYYEDTDAAGVVYHANYLRFMERARTEWLRSLGFELPELASRDGVLFAVRSIHLECLQPARLNQQLMVDCRLSDVRRTAMVFAQNILRDQDMMCRSRVEVVCVDAETFRPRRIPEKIVEKLDDIVDDT